MKTHSPKPAATPSQISAGASEVQRPLLDGASTAMNLGGPMALEADPPSEDLLGEFMPSNKKLATLESELVQGMKTILRMAIGHAADAGHRRDDLDRCKWVTDARALISKAEARECAKVESVGPTKGLELTITVHGNNFGDLSTAINEVSRLVGQEYLSGGDSNDTGQYSFDIKGEEFVPQKKLEFDVKLSRRLKDQEKEALLERLQANLDDHQLESSVAVDGRKLTISCEGGIDEYTKDRIEQSVISTLDDANLSYTFSYEINDIED